MIPQRDLRAAPFPQTVLWTRGDGCHELADLLASKRAIQVVGDPYEAGIRYRADMVVMKQVGSLDLLPVGAPTAFDAEGASNIVAAVGHGPNSRLATIVASRLAERLNIPAEAVTAVRPGAPRAEARRTVDRARANSGIPGRVVEARSEAGLLESIPPSTLLVLGAPGGSWLHRQFFGPGARLRTHAPAGTIVVRDAPRRAFHFMTEPAGVSGHLRVREALGILSEEVTPVVDEGHLVGVIRREALVEAEPDREIADVMETPAFVEATDEVGEIEYVLEFYEGSRIPLVDRKGKLVGLLDPTDVAAG
ncbi:MAG TPA: CBS domain-containing protein [Acidimicrobiia bacterium]|nr:CBS domain-containing protein [Acidimicrobiia bacterium]